jgi:hypothetical protein
MKLPRIAALTLLVLTLCGIGVYAARQASTSTAPTPLASFAPSGALLAIESPDFTVLLHSWINSPEQRRWLAGDNYAAFSRSRLFGRLGDAQSQFATVAGLAPDAQFLQQVAGQQSLFAWYDIGNLQFLYITRMAPGAAAKTPLLQLRDKFEQRSAGSDTFFVRIQTDPQSNTARTVAFAVHGDYLLLATREDLIAGALQRMQQPSAISLLHDPWYANSIADASAQPGDLRMTLDLAAIVPSPYFRSYWIQQNITELTQYTAAISDLYRTSGNLREERVLLPADPSNATPTTDLAPVLRYLSPNIGVYRATAQPTPQQILDQLEDKLLTRQPGDEDNPHIAPIADLSTPTTGHASNLEQRIDEPLPIHLSRATELTPLSDLLTTLHPTAMLVFSTAASPTATNEPIFTPIRNAIVLAASSPWNESSLQQALNAALASRITVGNTGLTWSPHHEATSAWYSLDGPKHLAFAIDGNRCILASDPATLLQLLAASHAAPSTPRIASTITGFSLLSEQAPFTHLTALLDYPAPTGNGNPPSFFSGNIGSLAATFQDLASETFTETAAADHTIHQSVLYQWKR